MIRIYIFLLLFSFSFLNASLIKKVEVYETSDRNMTIEEVKKLNSFKRTKLPFIRHSSNIFFLRITFDKSKLKEQRYSIEFDSEFNYIQLDKATAHIDIYKNKIIEQSYDNFTEVVYVKVNNVDLYANFNIYEYETNEYASKQLLISRLYGVAYGIIAAAFLYYLALYLFNRERSYIYYSLTQLLLLCILVFLSHRELENDRILMDLIFFSFFVCSNLFTKNFLNTKKYTPKIDRILTVSIFVYLFDILLGWATKIYILADHVPLSGLLIFYLIAGIIVYSKGNKPVLFYLFGWGLMIFSFLFIEVQYYFFSGDLLIKPNYILHFVTPLESLILAFALSYKMRILEQEKQEQQEFLTQQSKLASMGEMIGNIAHQWRQPLTHLSYIMMNLKTAYEKDRLTDSYFKEKSQEAQEQLNYMSHTIDDFRDFFKVTKNKEEFSLVECINEVINLLNASFQTSNIQVKFSYEKDINISSLKGELLQVLFNLLNNCKDEFVKKQIDEAFINIELFKEEENIFITIKDNALGIDKKIINKIFEPYFTTKDKGLGMGLYMSKMIIEKSMQGTLIVKNEDNGAKFIIKL